jgi:hypothetical protein
VAQSWSRAYCKELVESLLPAHSREFASALWDKASVLCHFSGDGDQATLTAFGRGADQIVFAILEESDRPLHYSEIAVLATQRAGREIDERRVHNSAAEVGHLLGPGIFGTARHLGLDAGELMVLAEEASALVTDGPSGRQWHASELAAAISDDLDWADRAPNKYVIDVALRLYSPLKWLGRMVWSVAEARVDAMRVEGRQAIIAALQQAGGPLKGSDLQQRLITIRGVNENSNFVARDPIVKLGSGYWGLNDRDLPVKRQDQPALQEKLLQMLEVKGVGLHVSEIQIPVGLTPRMFMSIASLDTRIQASPGQYMYLRTWGGPRRQTMTEACLETLRSSGQISFEELYSTVTQKIGRLCDRREVSSALQRVEACLGPDGLWSYEDPAEWQDFEAE